MFKLCIKEKRISRNMSQHELSKKTKLNQSYISHLESDNRHKSPTLKTLMIIAKALDVTCPLELIKHCDFCGEENCSLLRYLKENNKLKEN